MMERLNSWQIILLLFIIVVLFAVILSFLMGLFDYYSIWRMDRRKKRLKSVKLPLSIRYYAWMESHFSEERAEELANKVKKRLHKESDDAGE